MNKLLYICFLCCLLLSIPTTGHAQTKHLIKGNIIDKNKREPLPYATVLIYGTGMEL